MSLDVLPPRFWAKVKPAANGCWIWTAGSAKYGVFPYEGDTLAHRVAYRAFIGNIPDGHDLHHKCRTKRCVNPTHTSPVPAMKHRTSHIVEVGRSGTAAFAAMNRSRTHCRRGHEFSDENTFVNTNNKRQCRACMRRREKERHVKWRDKRNEAARARHSRKGQQKRIAA